MRKFFYIIIAFFAIMACSCEQKSSSSSKTSSVAKLTAFTFVKNDTMPGLGAAEFTIEERLDTGLVFNKDSMLFGTKLDRVIPRFTFAATPGAAFLTFPDTTVVLTGYDTLNFNKQPIYLTIRSSDRKVTKVYQIKPTVHQADPDLYVWTQLNEGIYPEDDSEQRVVEVGEKFIMISSNGFDLDAYSSADGISWEMLDEVTGLPAGTKVRQIVSDSTTLYYGQDSIIYTSTDAVTWEAHEVNKKVSTMLFFWNDQVWASVEEGERYELAIFEDNALIMTGLKPYGDFPISDFATVTFISASTRSRAMIIGGFAENGKSLNTRWNLEYSPHIAENNGYRMEEYSIDRPHFTSLTGISVVNYDDRLMLFGGVNANRVYLGRDIYVSLDEGLNWTKVDSTKNQLPEIYQARQKMSAIVRNNYIYLFGGEDAKYTYSDVYRGKLNSINWPK